jgi:hypothetical protein
MVKIRYAELPAGLHVVTEEHDGCTIIYLQPGLTPAQRRAALAFARGSARIGHGPSLPATDMAFALAADRARTTGRNLLAALRRHPMLLVPLIALVSGVIVVSLLSLATVSIVPTGLHATDPAPHRGMSSSMQRGTWATPTPFGQPMQPAATDLEVPAPSARSDTPSASGAPLLAGRASR